MKVKNFKIFKLVLFSLEILAVGYALWSGYAAIAFLGIGLYMVLVTLIKTRVDGVLADERLNRVSEKASEISFKILMPMLLLTSVAMMMGGGSENFYYIRALGVVLSYVTSLGLFIYLLAYWYFDRETGGR